MKFYNFLRTTVILLVAISFINVTDAKKKKKGQNPPKKKRPYPMFKYDSCTFLVGFSYYGYIALHLDVHTTIQ